MSYAMALDNSWDVMCEEEMYDVNGGWGFPKISFNKAFLKASKMFADIIVATLTVLVTANTAVLIYEEFSTAPAGYSIFKSLKAIFWNWKAVVGLTVIALATIYAIYIY